MNLTMETHFISLPIHTQTLCAGEVCLQFPHRRLFLPDQFDPLYDIRTHFSAIILFRIR